ncbi:MAG: hypothetical protein ACFFAJ_04785 [Candidatus Hodarchaeota archaeon]
MYIKNRCITGIIVIVFVFSSVPAIIGVVDSIQLNDKISDETSRVLSTNETDLKLTSASEFIANDSFDVESLFNYIKSLFNEEQGIFSEIPNGYETSIATYEALSILRFFGLDYYQFGSNWQEVEDTIRDKLLIDLRDESGSGGFKLTTEARFASLKGTFGVVASLRVMNEQKLLERTIDLLDFVYNRTFDNNEMGFQEIGQDFSIQATFHALTILDLIRQIVIENFINPYKPVNQTVIEFMANYSVGIFNFLERYWVDNSYFYSESPYRSPIEDTWFALKSIEILEKYGNILGISFSKTLADYETPVKSWLKSHIKTSGITKGGFGTYQYATVNETGKSYAIFNLFNATNELDHSETIKFINSSQFLKRENRTYLASESMHFGGFGPNNITYKIQNVNKRVNIHDTYFAALTLLLSGDIFNSIEYSFETSYSKNNPGVNRSDFLVQGEMAEIEQYFTLYNYRSHGSLDLVSTVITWNLTHPDYTEINDNFLGKSNATYIVKLENDSQASYNWTLGSHHISNLISIRNLPVIRSPNSYINSTLFVGFATKAHFNQTSIKPGDNVTTTIYYQNRSVLEYSAKNITLGSISANITSPNGQNEVLLDLEQISLSIKAVSFLMNFSKQALLGTWQLTLVFNQSDFKLVTTIPIEVSDTVIFYNISKTPEYYPGEPMNLNVSMKYTNGQFTPKANASIVFMTNYSQNEVFSLNLAHSSGNTYSLNNQECPTRFLYGFYNISIHLTWNISSGYKIDSILNESLPVIHIKGIPMIIPTSFNTDYRTNLILLENNQIYFGETINLSFKIGFHSSSKVNMLDGYNITVKSGLVNNTKPDSLIQLFQTKQSNNTLYASCLINPNLPNSTFGTRFLIQSDWNNSFVNLRNQLDITSIAAYNITLNGDFVIRDVTYIASEESDGLYAYALDTTSVVSVSFQVSNKELNNISVPNLNLYGILDIQGKAGYLNQSLPSITSAIHQNGTSFYQLSFPPTGLKPSNYEITIFAWTAIKPYLMIGQLEPGFKIVRTFNPRPLIQVHEMLILISGLGAIILGYLNFRKFR